MSPTPCRICRVIGDIIRITSVYKKQTGDEYHFEDIQAPELEGSGQMQEPVESINEDVDALVSRVMAEYERSIARYTGRPYRADD